MTALNLSLSLLEELGAAMLKTPQQNTTANTNMTSGQETIAAGQALPLPAA